jgi:molecular chaperone DnaK (HSP70)
VEFTLDANGIVRLDRAELMKEVVEEAPAAPAEGADATAAPAATEPPKKKRYTKVPLTVEAHFTPGYSSAQIEAYVKREAEITAQDTLLRETRDKRNELESYIYGMRNKLMESLAAYATETDKAALNDKLNDAENWLYGDGFDEAKSVYQMKLDELKSLGDPIARREHEFTYRSEAAKAVGQQVEFFRKIALSSVRVVL